MQTTAGNRAVAQLLAVPTGPRGVGHNRQVQRDIFVEEDSVIRDRHARILTQSHSFRREAVGHDLSHIGSSASYIDNLAESLRLSGDPPLVEISWANGSIHAGLQLTDLHASAEDIALFGQIYPDRTTALTAVQQRAAQLHLQPDNSYGYYFGPEGSIWPTHFTNSNAPRIHHAVLEAIAQYHEQMTALLEDLEADMIVLLFNMLLGRFAGFIAARGRRAFTGAPRPSRSPRVAERRVPPAGLGEQRLGFERQHGAPVGPPPEHLTRDPFQGLLPSELGAEVDTAYPVFRQITPTQPTRPGTAIPRSFTLRTTTGHRYWVSGAATEHFPEALAGYRQHYAGTGRGTDAPRAVIRQTTPLSPAAARGGALHGPGPGEIARGSVTHHHQPSLAIDNRVEFNSRGPAGQTVAASALVLEDFEAAASLASNIVSRPGFTSWNQEIQVGNWEFIFARPNRPGGLVRITHANPRGNLHNYGSRPAH
ncbi:hypothetical protein [Microbacterium sp. BK668]|uniref:hypothetical protein n=1 Tax=Microbacterium sp. BK668 TaxID=2512118 RepID=UPI001060DDB9|nr:hypothetical protein [Microbacterium sp. BK668]